jgi:hypothetical protein
LLRCSDLELPLDFTPCPQDGEVSEFFRLPLSEVAALVAAGDPGAAPGAPVFKDNCNLVIIDFLVRHGLLAPDTRGYLDVLRGLRRGDCS